MEDYRHSKRSLKFSLGRSSNGSASYSPEGRNNASRTPMNHLSKHPSFMPTDEKNHTITCKINRVSP
jgi:hypothetical protein